MGKERRRQRAGVNVIEACVENVRKTLHIPSHNQYMEKETQRDKLCRLVLFRLKESEHSKMQISPVLTG